MNRKYTILTVLLTLACTYTASYGQEQPGLRERANKLYVSYQYAAAVPVYLKLAEAKNPKPEDVEHLADCYLKMNNYTAAESWYARAVQYPESKPKNLLLYSSVLKSNSKYAEAKKALQQYAEKTSDLKSVSNEIQGCDSALVWISNPTNHKIKNEELVNTSLSEFSVYPAGDKFFYTGEPDAEILKKVYGRTGNPYLRIYTAENKSANALSGSLMDKAVYNDGAYHIGPVISNKAGNTLFITRTYPGRDGEITKENKLKFRNNNLELYSYTLKNGSWEATAFPYNDVEKYSVGHAALSTDEKTLYFVSNMPGGSGGTDIWYCELQADEKWGQPQNAGLVINSAGDEMFPNISADGTLYYSSNGLPGMGGLDIFSTKGNKNQWDKPLNLRYPINSAGDDFSFIASQTTAESSTGYLSSNRKDGKGGDDIYSFSYVKPKVKIILALKGTTFNKKTSEILPDVDVTLTSSDGKIVNRKISKTDGTFFYELDKDSDYKLSGQKSKFYGDSTVLTTKGISKSDTLVANLYLEPVYEVGAVFVLKNLLYDFDKDNIRPDAAKILDGLVKIMEDHPTLEIELGSHTDSRGVDIYNLDLSQRRARSVVNYLVSRGIARSRMVAKGYGETQLVNKCSNGVKCSEEAHQANRRTEFKILKN